jgi:hypothetical protein
VRVLALRLACGVCGALLLFFGAIALCRVLEVPEPFAAAALLAIFSTEMFYATVAHVANDWLAIGVSAFFLAALAKFVRAPDRRSALAMAAWLSVGLLTKAYFLVFALFAAGIAAFRSRRILPAAALVALVAGPWYARNFALYRNLVGTQEAYDGIGIKQALAAARHIDWLATGGYLARASLWTGNNSFNSYSRTTLDIALALLTLGGGLWLAHRRAIRPAEWSISGAIALFLAALAYANCTVVADRPGQAVAGPSPWYAQVLLAPVAALVFLGLARSKRAGRAVAQTIVTLWAWVMLATWALKLFPMYSGGGSSAIRLREAWNWRVDTHALSQTALAPAAWLYAGLAVAVALTVGAAVAVVLSLNRSDGAQPPPPYESGI